MGSFLTSALGKWWYTETQGTYCIRIIKKTTNERQTKAITKT